MISDVLAEAIAEIQEYLNDDAFSDKYEGEMRQRIVDFIQVMNTMAIEINKAELRHL